jgi:hypothetical protein
MPLSPHSPEAAEFRSRTNLAIAFSCSLVAISIVTFLNIAMARSTHRITPPAAGTRLIHLNLTIFT